VGGGWGSDRRSGRRHPATGRGAAALGEEVGGAPADDGGGPRGEGVEPSWTTVAVHGEKEWGPRR
jgi:hypothetical protein